MPQADPWNLQGLNDDNMFVQPPTTPENFDLRNLSAPNNGFGWQSWGNSKGLGDFLGANMNTFAAGAKGIAGLGGLYLGLKQLSLAKNTFKLQKDAYNTNLANSTKSYNTQVGDRIAGRSYATEEERQAALRAASLPTNQGY